MFSCLMSLSWWEDEKITEAVSGLCHGCYYMLQKEYHSAWYVFQHPFSFKFRWKYIMCDHRTVHCRYTLSVVVFSLTLTKRFSVLLLTPDTTPAGHFFNQTQSPWDVSQLCETNSIQRRQSGKTGVHWMCQDKLASPQTQQHSNCLVWRPSSCGQTLNGEASSCPAGFSRYFRHWASAHTHSSKEERATSIRWSFTGEQSSVNR